MKHYLDLSRRVTGAAPRGLGDVTHLIWPESAFPFYLRREPDALAQIGDLLPEGTVLITGADRSKTRGRARRRASTTRSWCSITTAACSPSTTRCISCRSANTCRFRACSNASGFVQFTKVEGGYLAGEPRRSMAVPRAPRHSCRCCATRSSFRAKLMPRGERPGWLVNLTNDGWFGISTGPYQHLEQARLRAIETGLPLVRAANTGISAVDRSARPHHRVAAARRRRRARRAVAAAGRAAALCARRRYSPACWWRLRSSLVGGRRLRQRKGRSPRT